MSTAPFIDRLRRGLDATRKADFLAPLLLRFFLAPIFITAGLTKLLAFESTVGWFGNPDWGLGLPLPWLMAVLATATELVGGFLLLFGLGTRLIAIPLMVTMLVAAFAVHWHNGWFAIAPSDPSTSMARPWPPSVFRQPSKVSKTARQWVNDCQLPDKFFGNTATTPGLPARATLSF